MSEPNRACDCVRDVSVCLHRHHRVRRGGPSRPAVEMFDELVERFRARAARVAVLEEQQRAVLGLGKQAIELVDLCQGCQVGMRARATSQRGTFSSRMLSSTEISTLYSPREAARDPYGTRLRRRSVSHFLLRLAHHAASK